MGPWCDPHPSQLLRLLAPRLNEKPRVGSIAKPEILGVGASFTRLERQSDRNLSDDAERVNP